MKHYSERVLIKDALKEFKTEIKTLYGSRLKHLILYGSWARDEATAESDIDLIIVLEGNVMPGKEIDRMVDIVTDINLRHGVLISLHPISVVDFSTTNSPLLLNVRREGIPA